MEHCITVTFSDDQAYDFKVREADTAAMTWEQAQQWLDHEYVSTGYQAAQPVGMTLLADKILRIATAYGPQPFAENSAWAQRFASCTGRAVGKVNITVDVANQVVGM